jgi:hypothetical protein
MERSSRLAAASALVLVVAVLTACASPSASSPGGTWGGGALGPSAPSGEVVGVGTVLHADGAEPQLCLGAVGASLPPQCAGVPLKNWSWDAADGSESAAGTRWGAYAVQGTYDGESLSVTTEPVSLALYDPAPLPDSPPPGGADEATLRGIQRDLPEWLGDAFLTSAPTDGRLEVTVVWDDGTWQEQADAEFGPGVVRITSALRPVDSR